MSDPRLSYLQSIEDESTDFSSIENPRKNLTDIFNSVCEEEAETDFLKVFLRVRPLISEETITSQDGNVEFLNKRTLLLTAPNNSQAFKNKPQGSTKLTHKFAFSHIYNQESSQKLIFEETTQDLVKGLINCQNCLLFTYGATNSGKTYTIQGTKADPGLLPRTLILLFNTIGEQHYKGNDLKPHYFRGVVRLEEKESQKEEAIKEALLKGISDNGNPLSASKVSSNSIINSKESDIESSCGSFVNESILSDVSDNLSSKENFSEGLIDNSGAIYSIFASFAEIYNEYIYDLLDNQSFVKKCKRSPLALGEDRNGAIYIKGLNEIRIQNADEAMQVLEAGKRNLHFAETRLNHHSSRSHCIFTIKLIRLDDPDPHVARVSMLSLCDLAGAERAAKTLNSVDRQKEANNINTSLLVLGRCMTALRQNQVISRQTCGSKKSIPIPYRDSKVTRIFQSFFMGKGKVSMIVNISTSSLLFDETLKVLKFSALASKVTITQEKPWLEQSVVDKSRISRLVRHSLNMSTSSGRLSVPWENKSYNDVTFGTANEADNSRMMSVMEEENEEEEDERYEHLLELIEQLKKKLVEEVNQKATLETRLRKEICEAFSQRIIKIEQTWKNRLEEEQTRAEEFMDWRLKHVMSSNKKETGTRKRLRPSEELEEEEEMVPSILMAREEIKVKNLEEDNSQIQLEVNALKQSLKVTNQRLKTVQEENSKLVFQLADLTKNLDKVSNEKICLEESMSSAKGSTSSTEALIVEELQFKIQQQQQSINEKEKELQDMKDMLLEAAEEFHLKETNLLSLQNKIEKLTNENTQQMLSNSDLENQLGELKSVLANQNVYLEEREHSLDEFRTEIKNVKRNEEALKVKLREEEALYKEMEGKLRTEIETLKKSEEKNTVISSDSEAISELENKFQKEKEVLLQNFEDSDSRNVKLQEKMREQHSSMIDAKTIIESLNEEINMLENSLQEKIKNALEEQKTKFEELLLEKEDKSLESELQSKNNELESQINELNLEKQTLTDDKSTSEKIISESNQKIDRLRDNVSKMEDDLKMLKENLKKSEENEDSLTVKLSEMECENEAKSLDLIEENIAKDDEMNKLNKKLETRESNESYLLKRIDELKEMVALKEVSIKELWQEIHEFRKISDESLLKKKEFESKLKVLLDDKESLRSQLNSVKELNSTLEGDLNEVKTAFEELEKKKTEVENQLSTIREIKEEKKSEDNKELQTTLDENMKLKDMLGVISKKKLDLEELNFKSNTEIHKLTSLVEEKTETLKNMAAKLDGLDKKKNEFEESVIFFKSKYEDLDKVVKETEEVKISFKDRCDILEKEVAALREARAEEYSNQHQTLEEKEASILAKEQEIESLQKEMKKLIIQPTKEEKEDEDVNGLKTKLSVCEEERTKAERRLTAVLQELEEVKRMREESAAPKPKKKGRPRRVTEPQSETSELDSVANETPAPKSVRSTRGRKTKNPLVSIENATPEPLRLALDTSEGEDLGETPCPKTRSSSTKNRTRNTKTSKNLDSSFEADFKKPVASSRKKTVEVVRQDESHDEGSEEEYRPVVRKSSRSRGRKKASSRVFNPHLAEKENSSTLTNQSEEKSDTLKGRSGSRTKRRHLYSTTYETAPFECTPNLIEIKEQASPHTTVRHMLRSKSAKKK